MPTLKELPAGPRREFVTELHVHWREAGRPTAEAIAKATLEVSPPFSVSKETIRKLLKGKVISSNWQRVDAVLRALCHLAGQDPDRRRWPSTSRFDDEEDPSTCREVLRGLWNDDLDAVDGSEHERRVPPPPASAPPVSVPPTRGAWPQPAASQPSTSGWGAPKKADDPWGAPVGNGGFSDEPPF